MQGMECVPAVCMSAARDPELLRARLSTANELAAQKAERYLTSQQSRVAPLNCNPPLAR